MAVASSKIPAQAGINIMQHRCRWQQQQQQQRPPPSAIRTLFGDGTSATWREELVAAVGGAAVLNRAHVERETQRTKQEIDKSMALRLAQLETRCQEQQTSIRQQAEQHLRMAEMQVQHYMQQHQAEVTRQAEIQAHTIGRCATGLKERLGEEAAHALSQQLEHEKALVFRDAAHRTEDAWRQAQQALLQQAQQSKVEIHSQAARRTSEIEQQVRDAMARVYISPAAVAQPPVGGHVATIVWSASARM